MSSLKGNAVIGQSGGPTAVINQSLVGAIQECRKYGHIQELLGARHGVSGIVKNDFLNLKRYPDELVDRIAQTPAAALGSTRDKPDKAYCERILEVFRNNNVRFFFYIGGNDSADAARIVNDLAKDAKYDLHTFHIPKTIDNDLRVHDHTPGFGSAAKFVISAIIGDNYDNKSLGGIKVDVIMGRDAGFLTASSVLARHRDDDGPHLIYVPEVPLSEEQFLKDVDESYKRHGRCLIAVSEGITTPEPDPDKPHKKLSWAKKMKSDLPKDAHGNVQLSGTGALGDYLVTLIKKLKMKSPDGSDLRMRADTFGYPQRCFAGYVSSVDSAEARRVGEMAMQYGADEKNVEGSVAMRRVGGGDYRVETFLTPLSTVAKETKHLSPEHIRNGNDITDAFKEYARPLVGKLPVVGSFDEMK